MPPQMKRRLAHPQHCPRQVGQRSDRTLDVRVLAGLVGDGIVVEDVELRAHGCPSLAAKLTALVCVHTLDLEGNEGLDCHYPSLECSCSLSLGLDGNVPLLARPDGVDDDEAVPEPLLTIRSNGGHAHGSAQIGEDELQGLRASVHEHPKVARPGPPGLGDHAVVAGAWLLLRQLGHSTDLLRSARDGLVVDVVQAQVPYQRYPSVLGMQGCSSSSLHSDVAWLQDFEEVGVAEQGDRCS